LRINLSANAIPRCASAVDKEWGVHLSSVKAFSSMARSLASRLSMIVRTLQLRKLELGSRFSNIVVYVLDHHSLSLLEYPHKGNTNSAEVKDYCANRY
jgi:hypothetical protein